MDRCHKNRAARSIAISIKKFIPMPKKKDRRGAKVSTDIPDLMAARTYSIPSARVNAVWRTESAPASMMW